MAFEVTTSINLMFDFEFKYPVLEQVERIHRAGFDYLDFNFSDWSDSEKSPFAQENWREWVQSVRDYSDAHGIRFTQAHGPLYNVFGEDTPLKRQLDRLSVQSIEAAAIMGIPWIVYHAGTEPGEFDAAHIASLKEKNLRWFAPIVEACEKYNVGLAIENMASAFGKHHGAKSCYCSNTDDLIDLVDAFGSDRVGICWDTGHANVEHTNQVEDLRKIGKRLKAIHIQDNNGVMDQHLPPYLGNLDWPLLMHTFREIGYEGPFTFEAHTEVRKMPSPCQDDAMRLLKSLGDYLVSLK